MAQDGATPDGEVNTCEEIPNRVFFRLPAGYRPAKEHVAVTLSNDKLARVDVHGDVPFLEEFAGQVRLEVPTCSVCQRGLERREDLDLARRDQLPLRTIRTRRLPLERQTEPLAFDWPLAAGSAAGDTRRAMSQENVEVVRRALAALDSRDVEAYLEIASPDIELVTPESGLEGPSVGHDGIRRFFRALETYAETSGVEIEEIRPVNDRVLALFKLTTSGRDSSPETSVQLAGVYDLEHGKIRRARVYADRAQALEAVGLSE